MNRTINRLDAPASTPPLSWVFPAQQPDPNVNSTAGVPNPANEAKGITFTLLKSVLSISNLDNTSDVNKPISSATAAALANKSDIGHTHIISSLTGYSSIELLSNKGAANGYAPLDSGAKISATYLPSYVDDVLEFANLATFPSVGETGKIYVAINTNETYRWSGSIYVRIANGAVQSVNGSTGIVVFNYEQPLGNPTVNGYVLSSTIAGVRSWIAPPTGTGTSQWTTTGNDISYATGNVILNGSNTLRFTNTNNNFWEVVPLNYNPSLKQGKFSANVAQGYGVNGAGNRDNVVLNFASYNDNGGGGPDIIGEASYRFAGETNYRLEGVNESFEFHLPDVFLNTGVNIRPMSCYLRKISGFNNWNYQTNGANYSTPVANGGVGWLTMNLVGNDTRVEFLSVGLGNSELIMHGYSGAVHNTFKITTYGDNGTHIISDTGIQFHNSLSFSDFDAAIIGSSSGARKLSFANGGLINLIGDNSLVNSGAIQILADRYTSGRVVIGSHYTNSAYIENLVIDGVTGNVSISTLAGTGIRMVVVSASGVLSTQAIPAGGGASQWTTAASDIYYSAGKVLVGGTLSINTAQLQVKAAIGNIIASFFNTDSSSAVTLTSTGGITTTGAVLIGTLAGTGIRMVTADATGLLSTQAIPVGGGGTSQWTTSGSSIYYNNPVWVGSAVDDGSGAKLQVAGGLHIGGSVAATTAIARGEYNNSALVAAANNDVLVGLEVAPTFTNGAFTGVVNLAARFTGNVTVTGEGRFGNVNTPYLYNSNDGQIRLLSASGIFEMGILVSEGIIFKTNGSADFAHFTRQGRIVLGAYADDGINDLQIRSASIIVSAFAGTGSRMLIANAAGNLSTVDGLTTAYVAKSAAYAALLSDFTIDCTSGSFTVTLPTAAGIVGRIFIVKNSGTGVITMAGTSAQTFDGAASPTIAAGAATQYQSNGANWIRIN